MAAQDPRAPEGAEVSQRVAEALTPLDEREMFRDAIPVSAPEVTQEEVDEIVREEEPGDDSGNESKDESPLALLAAPVEADVMVSPYSYGGRLFFTKPDGQRLGATAEFAGEHNILLTAAHCVRDASGAWFDDSVFYRAYKNGLYGRRFPVNYVGTLRGWVDSTYARYKYDFAFLRTTALSDVGALGIKTLGAEARWTEFGYPVNYGNNQAMHSIDGTRGRVQDGNVEMLGNPMRKGNSGGAWFIVAGPNNRQAVGNQSHNLDRNTTDAWGPVFTRSTFDLLRFVRDAA